MNTVKELIENGLSQYNANKIIVECNKRVGTTNGVYLIKDMTYDFKSKGKIVTLECTKCGAEIQRTMISGRNKWSELIKTCQCEKESKTEKRRNEKKYSALKRVGEMHGDFKIVALLNSEIEPQYVLRCKTCGYEMEVCAKTFSKRKRFEGKNCKKKMFEQNHIKYDEKYVGRKYNFLTVKSISRLPNGHKAFLCKCDCGNEKLVEPVHWEQGIVKSCGCKHDELVRKAITKHGYSESRLYHVWNGMKSRCYNDKNINYRNYGGRGIKVCDEWQEFVPFMKWAYENGYDENAPRGEYTIDRIDVNGNYEPSNCRWVDMVVQANNKRPPEEWKTRGKKYKFEGKKYTIPELRDKFKINDATIRYRMKVKGMTLEEALKMPKITTGRPRKEVV